MYLKLFCVTTYIYCLDDSFLTCRYTCCKDGELYHCCPLPEAVCCSDNIHCCPRGFECSPDNKRCSSGSHSILALSTALPKTVSTGLSRFLQQILKTVSKEWLSRTVQKRRQSVVMKEKVLENVICPDGQSECPDGSTCCKLSSGQWGCCPLPKAVCCSDGVHCCPNGYTCDTSAGTCNKGSMTVPMVQKMPSSKGIIRIVKANNVVCPDGQSECPDGSTCCKLSSGQWGCCPLPKAVCCSDGVHCCPNGYTCDTSAGTCNKGSMTVPIVQKMPSSKRIVRIVKANNVVCPDGQSECPDGSTCCKLSSGQWGCCPLPKAVCCSDGVHCCPNGYTCDPSAGTCNKGITTVPMLQKMASSKKIVKANNVLCPDGVSECPDGNTCCRLSSGQYGCCPLPKAVCCSDGVHCCPNGYTCDTSAGTCNKGIKTVPMVQKMLSSKRIVKANNFVCPGGASQCPDGNTCCLLSSGQYGCCPLPNAVCCSDGVHCCPNGYTCDTSAGTCNKGSMTVPMVQKMLSSKRIVKANNVVCPDGASQCPDGNTCCKLASGQYGCCPLPKAVCCSDGVHCCPNGYTCDTSAGTCNKGIKTVPMVQKMLSSKGIVKANNVVCPDGVSECPDGNTCCRLSSGQYGCCPLPKAVCCSDGVHCCPNGYTCDTSAGTCNKGIKTVPMVQKMLSSKGIVKANNVVCPDGVSECPDGNTCCKLASGQYGCCPLPRAVCCSDGEHCCPEGYTCDTSAGTCNKESKPIYMLQTMPSLKENLKGKNVICPDEESECPDGFTCCLLASGEYGCCPLPNAVCCSDGKHCCPEGYICDVSAGTCNRGSSFLLVLQKIDSLKRNAKVGKSLINNVICPGDKVQCPTNQTCCKLSSGVYGCCPAPDAVCCSDGEHCCPHGYICDLSTGNCIRDRQLLPLRLSVSNVKNVVCPDGASECPDGNTCCKLASGQYGCCPLPKAVCCSDGVHCCPNGYTCDTSAGTCNKGSVTVPMLQKMASLRRIVKGSNFVCPDGVSQCPDGYTCCKLASGQYGCCPLPKAVCCSDGVHCCPNGYTCDTSAGTCNKGSVTVPMLQKVPATRQFSKTNVCPDGSTECPGGYTCCKLASGEYGCCHYPNAVCCKDGEHCCPDGYTCNPSAGTCTEGGKSIPLLRKMPGLKRLVKATNVICPDGQSECPDGSTCCKLSSGQWGCCPLPKAVCCSDGVHCCPNGYTCDTSAGTCNKGSMTVPMVQKMPSSKRIVRIVKATNVICPDGQSECPDGSTCCKLSSGQWGCCPLPKAVCCSDGVHCCPNGYTCDTSAGTCNKGSMTVPMVQKMPSSKGIIRIVKANNVVCPDGQSECPDGSTCCKLSSGQWGCCPLPKAVCCSDGVHCCPNGYTCDTSAGTCNKGSMTAPIVQKMPSSKTIVRIVKATNVICPDGESECPDGSTCCKLSSGQCGCCPLPKAVCCSDGVHCCPNGYTCDTSAGTCNKGSMTVPMVQKMPSSKRIVRIVKATNVVCPDGASECPDGNTCCKLSSGQWGCCPLPKAVCCSDEVHCCPNGYTCDTSAGTCNKGSVTVPMLQKVPATLKFSKTNVCPDGSTECPGGYTCCKLASGEYGCCHYPNAVCCKDGEHCCPDGYTCNPSAGTCTEGGKSIPLLRKMPGLKRLVKATNVICPDGQSECPDGNTCCKLSSGQWGCCPLPKAVCCSDGVHCCPNGYTCDTSAGTCNKGSMTVPMVQKMPSSKRIVKANSVVCPDGQSECPDGSTCCKLSSGQWGCCPLPKAVCCSDGVHCCPNGYTCDTSAGTCNKGSTTVPMLQKMASSKGIVRIVKANNVVCPGGQSECPDGSTCCKLSSGQWGCCPLPKAVCCSDGVHCCPNGYTCDTSAGTCNKGSTTVLMLQKMLSSKGIVKASSVLCPDGVSECPDGDTCCKLASGQYGCCPFPKAVCCSDRIHCCPNGYTCDTSAGTCNKGSTTQPMLRKMPSTKRIVKANNVVCPDGASECPDGNTCCRLSSGQYGCCPLPGAVCCSDGVHCCPNGYTCDTSAGTCNKGIITVPMLQTTSALIKTAKVDTAHEDVDTVFCPDGESECPNDYTCCKDTTGQYGCCPKGFTCNSNGTCHKGSERLVQTIMVSTKSPVDPVANSSVSVLCPDKKYQCPGGSTCCKLHSGSYGCCPIEKAVCCSDDKHCCPEGYTCDLKEG